MDLCIKENKNISNRKVQYINKKNKEIVWYVIRFYPKLKWSF